MATDNDTAITLATLIALTDGLDDHDWLEFASRIHALDPALAEFERMHAAAADGNSPSLRDWPRLAIADATLLRDRGIANAEQARDLWTRLYA